MGLSKILIKNLRDSKATGGTAPKKTNEFPEECYRNVDCHAALCLPETNR